MAEPTDIAATPAGIRAALLDQLDQAVAQRAAAIAEAQDQQPDSRQAFVFASFAVRDLAEALKAVDAVAIVERQQRGAAPPFDIEALATRLWNVSQEAGGSTGVGDAIVAALRQATGATA